MQKKTLFLCLSVSQSRQKHWKFNSSSQIHTWGDVKNVCLVNTFLFCVQMHVHVCVLGGGHAK